MEEYFYLPESMSSIEFQYLSSEIAEHISLSINWKYKLYYTTYTYNKFDPSEFELKMNWKF